MIDFNSSAWGLWAWKVFGTGGGGFRVWGLAGSFLRRLVGRLMPSSCEPAKEVVDGYFDTEESRIYCRLRRYVRPLNPSPPRSKETVSSPPTRGFCGPLWRSDLLGFRVLGLGFRGCVIVSSHFQAHAKLLVQPAGS